MAAATSNELSNASSDPLHVWLLPGWGFRGRRIERRHFRFDQVQVAAGGHFEELQMAITQQRVIRYTSCLVLGWAFLARTALYNLTAHELHELYYDIIMRGIRQTLCSFEHVSCYSGSCLDNIELFLCSYIMFCAANR